MDELIHKCDMRISTQSGAVARGMHKGHLPPPLFSRIDYIANCYFDFLLYKYQH